MGELQHRTVGAKRLTVGLLAVNSSYYSETLLFEGARRAAAEHHVDLIYFSPFATDIELARELKAASGSTLPIKRKLDQIAEHIASFELDGLVIIGWSREFDDEYLPYFRDRIAPVKLLSLGKLHDKSGIPSVISSGSKSIRVLIRHLVERHGRKRIGFIPSLSADDRLNAYADTMRELGCRDERLVIHPEDLDGIDDIRQRMSRAVELLLDELPEPADAIMTMNQTEGLFVLELLQQRGIRVPEEIALVTYEDSPVIAYNQPSLTTIDYPFRDIGYCAFDHLIRMLRGEEIPLVHEVPCVIHYRDSCGCTVNRITPMADSPSPEAFNAHQTWTIEAAAAAMRNEFPEAPFDYRRLAELALDGIADKDGSRQFLETLWQELGRLRSGTSIYKQRMVNRFREQLLPAYAPDPDLFRRAESMWFASRFIASDAESSAIIRYYIEADRNRSILDHINQALLLSQSTDDLLQVLTNHLGWIGIPTAYLFMDETPEPGEKRRTIFAFTDLVNIAADIPEGCSPADVYRIYRSRKRDRICLIVMPLVVNEATIGLAWFEPGRHELGLVHTFGMQISKAFMSVRLMEETNRLVHRLSREIELRREKEAQLAYYADVDSLTRLFNRRFFYNALEDLAAGGRPFAVFYIDIDGFKHINDTFGHQTGDDLLSRIADRLRKELTGDVFQLPHISPDAKPIESESIFRLGGDEFTALVPTIEQQELVRVAERIIEAVRMPFKINGSRTAVSASVGIGIYPDDAVEAMQLLHCADLAMYAAKRVKNTYRFYREIS